MPPASPTSPLQRLLLFRSDELARLLWSTALFFCVLAGYFVLRPVRETWGIEVGDNYRYLWTITAVVTLAVTPVFGWLVGRLPRRRLVPLVYAVAILCLLAFRGLREVTDGDLKVGVGYAFYVWLSVFNLFATAVFWSFMVDLWRAEQCKRLFGFIAVGGTLGALWGGLQVAFLDEWLGSVNWLLVSSGYFVLAIVCVLRVTTLFERTGSTVADVDAPADATWVPQVGWRAAVDGIALFARSRYLLAIGLFLAAQTLVAAVLYVESRSAVGNMFPTRGEGITDAIAQANRSSRTDFFAYVDIGYNLLALSVQLFLTGRLVRWVGLAAMLGLLPLINAAGFTMLAFAPTVVAYGVFEVLQKGTRFAIMKPAREMLFTVVSRDEKYKAKQFLDTAIYRSTDALWVWVQHWTTGLIGSFATMVYVVVPVCVGWAGLGGWLGRAERRLSGDEARAGEGSLGHPAGR